MKKRIIFKALMVLALIFALCKNANAQGDVTYEYRTDSVCAPTYVWNKTHAEYIYFEVKIEKRTIGERPTTVYAMDTDGKDGFDTWTNNPEACATLSVNDCMPLENSDRTIIFEGKDGQDNIRIHTAQKVSATF